jgi:hypothetical protein
MRMVGLRESPSLEWSAAGFIRLSILRYAPRDGLTSSLSPCTREEVRRLSSTLGQSLLNWPHLFSFYGSTLGDRSSDQAEQDDRLSGYEAPDSGMGLSEPSRAVRSRLQRTAGNQAVLQRFRQQDAVAEERSSAWLRGHLALGTQKRRSGPDTGENSRGSSGLQAVSLRQWVPGHFGGLLGGRRDMFGGMPSECRPIQRSVFAQAIQVRRLVQATIRQFDDAFVQVGKRAGGAYHG